MSGWVVRALLLVPAIAAWSATVKPASAGQAPPVQQPAETKAAEALKAKAKERAPQQYEETVVVSASKVEEKLVNAPATMSVIGGRALQNASSQGYADLFRALPGVNVTQVSARDVNLTSRGATSTLSTNQLTLLDGRTMYQDFFGFVMWDLLPINMNEIKQIEVIHGPASAVWGANALNGVINIITKSPREMQGTTVTLGAGGIDRTVAGGASLAAGGVGSIFATHARALNDRWSFKVSGGASSHAALPRPAGTIDNSFRTPYPAFVNEGTRQPKLDVRVDYDRPDGKQKLVVAAGFAGTSGMMHTGIGPFRIDPGSGLGYFKANYQRGALKVNGFVNILNGDASNLLSVDTMRQPIRSTFKTWTYDFEMSHATAVGATHAFTYGGNIRHNRFDVTLASRGSSRDEVGAYVQDEIFLSKRFRWVIGGRLDRFDVLARAVFSPRTTFMIKPNEANTVRVSYNRAYRAPSLVNTYLHTAILNQIDLGLISPQLAGVKYSFTVTGVGNPDLEKVSVRAFEVGYTGIVANRATVTAAWYLHDTKNDIFFTQHGSYSSSNVPAGWPLSPLVLNALIASNAFGPGLGLPSRFTYLNLGSVRDRGVELGIDASVNQYTTVYANYSRQARPIPAGFDISELNLPPANRFNAGFSVTPGRIHGNLSVSYTGPAYWQDVLDRRYHGSTDAYTLVNGGVGVGWAGGKVTASLKVVNLTNADVLQHVFGDVLKRQILGELRVGF